MSHNFNIRGIEPNVMAILKKEASKQKVSINELILKLIEKSLGYTVQVKRPTYHDLDELAGTWSKKEAEEFKQNTDLFEKIDEDIWS